MSRDCPFLYWDKNICFMGGYCCRATKERILTGSAIYENYCHNYEDSFSLCPNFRPNNNISGGCYLTSACTEAMNLPDNCQELRILRAFRDNWLIYQPGGREDIEEYYRIAPKILSALHQLPNCKSILSALYQSMVAPCADLIKSGLNDAAWELYRSESQRLQYFIDHQKTSGEAEP